MQSQTSQQSRLVVVFLVSVKAKPLRIFSGETSEPPCLSLIWERSLKKVWWTCEQEKVKRVSHFGSFCSSLTVMFNTKVHRVFKNLLSLNVRWKCVGDFLWPLALPRARALKLFLWHQQLSNHGWPASSSIKCVCGIFKPQMKCFLWIGQPW